MEVLTQGLYTGERALYAKRSLELFDATFQDGESPLKECEDILLHGCIFKYRYPLWYCNRVTAENTTFLAPSRAGMWYTTDLTLTDCLIASPKNFRRCERVSLTRCMIPNAEETFWHCKDVTLSDVSVKGEYFGMNCENFKADKLDLQGQYSFDGAKNVEISRMKMVTKDCFWNCENVTVRDSTIIGEYIGWNSKNVTFINCTIDSEQGLCYMDNVKLVNCKLLNTDLCFELVSDIDAEVVSEIDSVKNPISGTIRAKKIRELIVDPAFVDPAKTKIETED